MRVAPLLLAALALAPLAAADHVFSHRLYVVGRVIDSEGHPVSGARVETTFSGVNASAFCLERPSEVTDARGDYAICRHAHAIPDDAAVTVRVLNASRSVPIDPDMRHAVASLQLDAPTPVRDIAGERHFSRTFTVAGRSFALLADPREEEGIVVNATPLFENVSVEIRGTDGAVIANGTDAPDEYGRFVVDLTVIDVPTGALVVVRGGPEVVEEVASAAFRRADVALARDLRLVRGPGEDAPGSQTPMPAWLALTAAAACAAFARGPRARR